MIKAQPTVLLLVAFLLVWCPQLPSFSCACLSDSSSRRRRYLQNWEQWLVRDRLLSSYLWESIEIDVSFNGHLGDPCLPQISIFKRYNYFQMRAWTPSRKLFAQSTPNFTESHSCKIWIRNKALFNSEDQSINLYKARWKDNHVPW